MGSSARIQLRRIREVTPGTTPGTNMDIVPYATWKASSPITRIQPQNVSADRQPRDNPASDRQVSGQATSDYLYAAYDPEFESAFCAAMAATVAVTATDIEAEDTGNKLIKAAGGWSTLVAGDIVRVTGFVTPNPTTFVALVTSVTATDLVLAWPDVADEAAGGSITVTYIGRLRLGTTLLTHSYEKLNLSGTKGEHWKYFAVNSLGLTVPEKGLCSLNFGYSGGDATPVRLTAALGNSSNAASTNKPRNCNVHFGAASFPTQGLGFRYGGVLLTDLRIQSLKLTLNNPQLALGGVGSLGPTTLDLDQLFNAMLELTFLRTGDSATDLIADSDDVDTVVPIGFGFRDSDGLRDYWYGPAWQPYNEEDDGLKQAGQEIVSLKFMARYDSVSGSMLQYTKLG